MPSLALTTHSLTRKIGELQLTVNKRQVYLMSKVLHHPLDGVTNPEYKLLRSIQLTNFFAKREGTSF
jgi:hypothetical protein